MQLKPVVFPFMSWHNSILYLIYQSWGLLILSFFQITLAAVDSLYTAAADCDQVPMEWPGGKLYPWLDSSSVPGLAGLCYTLVNELCDVIICIMWHLCLSPLFQDGLSHCLFWLSHFFTMAPDFLLVFKITNERISTDKINEIIS